jgi:TPP-dependent pyruvate/acetoin dehydrogenase alpha subunit
MNRPEAPRLAIKTLLDLYRQMLTIRRFEETALDLRWADHIQGVIHPSIGQEAVAVGVCHALEETDRVVSNHRGHGHAIARGARIDRMMAELFGRATGYCKGKGGSMHIADFESNMLGANGIVGAGVPMAVGAAYADRLDDNRRVSVVFFGDGALGQGIVYESMNMAALFGLNVVFVCENNGYAAGNPSELTVTTRSLASLGEAHGLRAHSVDGNAVEDVWRVARAAVADARSHTPSFVECRTYRLGVHATRLVRAPDSRDPEELRSAASREPLVRLRGELIARGADPSQLRRLAHEVDEEVARAVEWAEASPYPAPEDALLDVFA